MIEDFRNHYRRTEAYKPTRSHSAFATFKDENQDKAKVCLCGEEHL